MIWEREGWELCTELQIYAQDTCEERWELSHKDGSAGRALASFYVFQVNVSPYALPICPLTFLSIYACLSVSLSTTYLTTYLFSPLIQPSIHPLYVSTRPSYLFIIYFLSSIYLLTYLSSIYQSSIFIYLPTYLFNLFVQPFIHPPYIFISLSILSIYHLSIYLNTVPESCSRSV